MVAPLLLQARAMYRVVVAVVAHLQAHVYQAHHPALVVAQTVAHHVVVAVAPHAQAALVDKE